MLRLAGPLLYRHLGQAYTVAGPHVLEFRANVGLLSRNVIVQGTSPFSQLDSVVKVTHGQSAPLITAPARPLCLLRARLPALGRLGTPVVRPSH